MEIDRVAQASARGCDAIFQCIALANHLRGSFFALLPTDEIKAAESFESRLFGALQAHGLWADYLKIEKALQIIESLPCQMTALTMATLLGSKAFIASVLDAGAMANLPDATGRTPLH